jgi:hypothetical protein
MNERTGDEIKAIRKSALDCMALNEINHQQYLWITTFWTLPPSAESLRETRAVA